MSFIIPSRGVTFWPVGNGDSTTISVNEDVKIQIDLHHLGLSEDDEEEFYPVVDELITNLPEKNSRPFLSVFVLTHPDKDHIKGFDQLLEQADIGELWLTSRIFTDDELSSEAEGFLEEANRRLKLAIKNCGNLSSGDRIRIFGYSDILNSEKFKGFPEDLLALPGENVTEIDGCDYAQEFKAFVHSPFKTDDETERNDTSIGLQITLEHNQNPLKILLFGDLAYEGVKKIFDITEATGNQEQLEWNILLAPHHCSKKVMYIKDENDKDILQKDIMNSFSDYCLEDGFIVSSSKSVPSSNSPGDNPPHEKAKTEYVKIATSGFYCTHGLNNEKNPDPITFESSDKGISRNGEVVSLVAGTSIASITKEARGRETAPKHEVGFGE